MHLPHITSKHPPPKRDAARLILKNRSPALINLPSVVGDILNPIVTPLLGGNKGPKPTSSAGSGGGNGNGNGNNGNSNGGGQGTATGGPGPGSGSSPPSTPPPNSVTRSDPTPTSPPAIPGPGEPGTPSPPDGHTIPSPTNNSGITSPTSSPPPASGETDATTIMNPVANVAAGPPPTQTHAESHNGNSHVVHTGGQATETGSASSPTSNSLPGGTGATPGATSPTGEPGTTKHGLSGAALTGILVACLLLLLAVILVYLRRRAILRRGQRREAWWERRNNQTTTTTTDSTVRFRSSVRSSFATTFDHGLTPQFTLETGHLPPLPPMAELRDDRRLVSPLPDPAQVLVSLETSQNTGSSENRLSFASTEDTHDTHTQYLYVANSLLTGEITTPMSVRPFSPSESFAFPKPPKEGTDRSSSRPVSILTETTTKTLALFTPPLPPTALNPFADPYPPPTSSLQLQPAFDQIEVVHRPFSPTRDDELGVSVEDTVKILRIFDDGWALVERVPGPDDAPPRTGTETPLQAGLIPLDCFRLPGQDLPSFFSEKRVSIVPYAESIQSTEIQVGVAA